MKADLDCAQVRVDLSARLDQELDAETSRRLDAHLATCAECRSYEEKLRNVKRAVALQPAPAGRDLAPAVTARLIRDSMTRRAERRSMFRTAIAAAAVTALVLSGALVPWQDRSPDVALASEITRAVQGAASEITEYHATFDVTERGWHTEIPERHMTAEIWFRAPEHLRFELRDYTSYPSLGWPTNDVTLVASPRKWVMEETASCPTAALPGCEISPEPETRALTNRQPFDGSTPLPTDLILPLQTLSDESGLAVVGRTTVNGRDAHQIALEYWQAAPLVRSLQVGGRWHRFPARTRVDLWLDAETWFPLRFSVRDNGASLTVENTSLDETVALDDDAFVLPPIGHAAEGGFRPTFADGPLPEYTAGLDPYRMGITRAGQRIATFADGLRWLRVLSDDDTRPTLATFASELVQLQDGGFGYVEPSTDLLRRTVEVIGNHRRVRLESNLPRGDLLEVAASVPLGGQEFDRIETRDGTIERVSAAALDDIAYAATPAYLPDGFEFSTAFVSDSDKGSQQVTVYYRRPGSAGGISDIRLIHAPNYSILPPTSENLISVKIGNLLARWSPQRSELEWLDGSTYRAVSVPGFDLETAAAIARDLQK